jgi:hypothetical protein
MTIAAAIEIGAGGTPAPGLGKAPGTAHGLGRTGVSAFELLSSTVSAATSFRANWQSLLVSLHSSMEGFSETEAGQETAPVSAAHAQISDTSSASSLTAGMDLRLGQGTESESLETDAGTSVTPDSEKGSGQSGAGVKLSPFSARAGATTAQPSAAAAKPISAESENTNFVVKQEAASAHGSRSARSINATKQDAVQAKLFPGVAKPDAILAGPLSGTLSEASSSLVLAVPAATSVIPVARGVDAHAQLAQTQISADRWPDPPVASSSTSVSAAASVSDSSSVLASVSASDLLNTQAPERNVPPENVGAASADVQQTANEPVTSANSAQAPPVSNLSSTSNLTRSETQTSVAGKSAPPTVVLLAESGNPPVMPEPDHSLTQTTTQTTARTVIPAETMTPSQISSPILVSKQTLKATTQSQNMTQAQVVRHSSAQTVTPSTNTVEAPETSQIQAPSQAPTPTFIPGQNLTLTDVPSQNPLQAQVTSQSPAQTEAPSTNSAESLTTSLAPSPTFIREQVPNPTDAPSQNPIQTQVTSQSPAQAITSSTNPAESLTISQTLSPTFVPEQNLTLIDVPSLKPIQTQVTSQGPAQIVAQSKNQAVTLATSQISSPAFIQEQVPIPTAALSQNPIQAQVTSQSPAQTEAPSTNQAVTLTTSQAPSPTFIWEQVATPNDAPSQNQIQTQVASQSPTHAITSSTNPAEALAASHAPSPAFIREQVSIPTAALSRNPVQEQVASQSLTQIAVTSTNTPETQALNSNPSSALSPDQNWTQKFVQVQEQIPAQPGNQGVNVVAVPIPGDGMKVVPVAASDIYQPARFSAQSPVEDKPSSFRGVKSSTSESIMQLSRGAGDFDSVGQAKPLVEGQSSADTFAMARAYTGASQAVSTASAQMSGSTAAATGPDLREAFTTLDTGGTPGKPAWIHAGAQRAEAGYQDPALGWVGVRADLSGGGVHAQLVPGSADAAQALGGHLAGLNAYLAEHHTPVETLTLQQPQGGWSGPGSGQGAGQGMQQGAGQETAQGADASSTSAPHTDTSIQSPAASLELPAFFGDMDGSIQTAGLGGYHISVMA